VNDGFMDKVLEWLWGIVVLVLGMLAALLRGKFKTLDELDRNAVRRDEHQTDIAGLRADITETRNILREDNRATQSRIDEVLSRMGGS